MTRYHNAVVLITGAGSGIGRELSLALSKLGANVLVTDINAKAAAEVADVCGQHAHSTQLDVCDAESFRACVNELVDKYGRIDFFFNNAGIGMAGEVYELPLSAWEKAITVNIQGVVNGIHIVYPIMKERGHGHIVNTASMAGLSPVPLLTPYAMTKHAVVGLSCSLRAEAAKFGVNVSTLCPAAIDTPLLEKTSIEGLPAMPWLPDIRRYLTKLSGKPYPVADLVREALDGVVKNKRLIIIPRKARMLAILARLFPSFNDKWVTKAAENERHHR
jgi:NAD(P)-dependent dehydrogenase (short-subunit alcohol dehydrogenase family)